MSADLRRRWRVGIQKHTFFHLQTSMLCIKTKEALTFPCWPQPPQGVRVGWHQDLSPTVDQGSVSAVRLGTLGLHRLRGHPWARCRSAGAQAGPAPSSRQMTGRAWLVLGNIAVSSRVTQERGFVPGAQAAGAGERWG